MNATAFEGGKVHLLTDQAARCGVGKHVRRGAWQIELGEVTCRRCLKIEARQGEKKKLTEGTGNSPEGLRYRIPARGQQGQPYADAASGKCVFALGNSTEAEWAARCRDAATGGGEADGRGMNGRGMGTKAAVGGTHCPTHRLEARATTAETAL